MSDADPYLIPGTGVLRNKLGLTDSENGRTQLEYLRQLADRAGHPLDPGKIGRDPWIAASKAAHQAHYAPMAAIIREQAIAERERRNQRAAQEHLRIIDAVIDKTLGDRPDAAVRLRHEAKMKLDAMLKADDSMKPPKTRSPADDPTRSAVTKSPPPPFRKPADRAR